MTILGYIAALFIGISLGLIGGGGSILTVPVMVYLFGTSPLLATSYSLFIVGTTSLVGAFKNYRKGLVNFRTALYFGSSSIATVFFTRKLIIPRIPTVLFTVGSLVVTEAMFTMTLFALLMLAASYSMIRKRKLKVDIATSETEKWKVIFYGILIGLVTGMLGAGGGFLIIPTLVLIMKLPMKMAVGTSLLIIAVNSLIGFTADLGHFILDWKLLTEVTLIAITGLVVGSSFSERIEGEKLKKGFGWFVLGMGIIILVKELSML